MRLAVLLCSLYDGIVHRRRLHIGIVSFCSGILPTLGRKFFSEVFPAIFALLSCTKMVRKLLRGICGWSALHSVAICRASRNLFWNLTCKSASYFGAFWRLLGRRKYTIAPLFLLGGDGPLVPPGIDASGTSYLQLQCVETTGVNWVSIKT